MAVLTFSTDASPDASPNAAHPQTQPNKKAGKPALKNPNLNKPYLKNAAMTLWMQASVMGWLG